RRSRWSSVLLRRCPRGGRRVGGCCGLRGGEGSRGDERVAQRGPPEQGALDTRRVARHPSEDGRVAELVLGGLVEALAARAHELAERLAEVLGLGRGATGHEVGEHGQRGLRDAAALPLPAHALDGVAGELDAERHLVAAPGVDLVRLAARRAVRHLDQAPAVRGLRVVEDDLLVHLLDRAHGVLPQSTEKNARTPANASRNASTSSRVVYTDADARAVAAIPNRRCSGCAQWWPTRTAIPASSSTWPTSCACTPSTTNDTTASRSTGSRGPMIRTPGISPMRSSSAASSCSCAATASMPSSCRYFAAAPNPTTCATGCVPASKRCGGAM